MTAWEKSSSETSGVIAPEELSYSSLESSRRVPEYITIPSSGSHTAAKVNADFGDSRGDQWLPLVSTEVLEPPKLGEMDNLFGTLELGLLRLGVLTI
jgi:hypothetical protein